MRIGRVPLWVLGLIAIGVLHVSLFGPAVMNARHAARRLTGLCHIQIFTLSLHSFATSNSGSLPTNDDEDLPRSWRTKLLQHVDHGNLQQKYQSGTAWDQEPNDQLGYTPIELWQIPNGNGEKRDPLGRYLTDIGFISGPGTAMPAKGTVHLEDIATGDGLGQTLMLGECSGLRIVWTEPRDPDVSREIIGIEALTKPGQTSDRLLSGYFTEGPIVGFADGAGRILSKDIDPKVLKALTTINGDERIRQEDYLR